MLKLANRAKMSTATTGTGTLTLGSAVAGYQSFADAGVANGDVVRYVIEDGNNWEIGQGTYTSSGTTLSRTVLESSNSDTAISLSGSATVLITAAAEDVAQVKIDTYTTAGSTTWTKPSWAKFVKVIAIGGGGGGGSGARRATTSARGGGGGGAGGAMVQGIFPANYLGATETVVVGAGGTGGASQSADTSDGQDGVAGGVSSFGSIFSAGAGPKGPKGTASNTGNTGSSGVGTFTSANGGAGQSGNTSAGNASSASYTQSYLPSTGGGGGGGAGASSTTGSNGGYAPGLGAPVASSPAFGGIVYANIDGGVGGTSGGAGGNGSAFDFIDHKLGMGGGGGSYATGQATGAGGNGAQPGGGGGGGAASDNGFNSGAGGNGGDGWVRVISWA
jgi:hypothetical protein